MTTEAEAEPMVDALSWAIAEGEHEARLAHPDDAARAALVLAESLIAFAWTQQPAAGEHQLKIIGVAEGGVVAVCCGWSSSRCMTADDAADVWGAEHVLVDDARPIDLRPLAEHEEVAQ
jgi:hypothetical protein